MFDVHFSQSGLGITISPTLGVFIEPNIKAMQEGLIFDIKRFAVHDGPGIRLTVFFKGCPLGCWWCHNPEGISGTIQVVQQEKQAVERISGKMETSVGRQISVNELMEEIRKEVLFFDESGGGVTFSGGEPLQQIDFLEAILKQCRAEEIHTALDTTGFCSRESLQRIMGLVDLFLYDIKLLDDEAHQRYTGISNRRILDNLEILCQNNSQIKIRFPVIPGITDSDQNISQLKQLFLEHPNIRHLALLPFHNIAQGKYKRFGLESRLEGQLAMSEEALLPLKTQFETLGLIVSIGG